MDTAPTDQIDRGTIITVVSARHNSKGQLRVEYGPLDIAWSEFDGGWVSVKTSAGIVAWEVHEEAESSDEEDSGQDDTQQNETKEEHCTRAADGQPGVSEPTHGFEVDTATSRPVLTSNRNKMDPSFGAALPRLSSLPLQLVDHCSKYGLWRNLLQVKLRTSSLALSVMELLSRLNRCLRYGHNGL